jgi:hypothetical protein
MTATLLLETLSQVGEQVFSKLTHAMVLLAMVVLPLQILEVLITELEVTVK